MSLFLKIIRKCGQGFSSFNNGRSSSVIYDKVKFNLTLLNQLCCIGGVLASQKLARSEDECTGNGDLRLICGHTRKDRIRNNDIQNKAGVTSIVEKMRLKWFRHVKRRCTDPLMRRYVEKEHIEKLESDMEKAYIEKFKKYENEGRNYLMSKYFSDKTILEGNISDVKMTEVGETTEVSRFPGYQSYADPANFNDGRNSGPAPNSTSKAPSNVRKRKHSSLKE